MRETAFTRDAEQWRAEMDQLVSDTIAEVCEAHPEWADPLTIDGQCFEASIALQEAFFEAGVIDDDGRGSDWDVVSIISCEKYTIDTNMHWAFRLGDTIIDLTARQFDKDLPFPLVMDDVEVEWVTGEDE